MYKVEIVTVVGSFIAETPEEINKTNDITAAGEYIASLAENAAYIELEDLSILRIKDPFIIKGYRVFNDHSIPEKGGDDIQPDNNVPWTARPGVFLWGNTKVKYLGDYRDVSILSAYDGDKTYYMLYQINGKPAEEFASPSNFSGIVTLWLRQVYGYDGAPAEVIVPHGTIDDLQEAKEYLIDYIRETAPTKTPIEKTGKAYTDWNEDRGRG